MRADGDDEGGADDEADRRPGERGHDRPAGGERVGAQDRQGSEDDPEGVLEAGSLRDVHGDRQTRRAADTVAKPHRAGVGVLERQLLRRLERRAGRPVRGIRPGGDERISRDLTRRVRDRADSERRLERRQGPLVVRSRRPFRNSPRERLRHGFPRLLQPVEIRPVVTSVEPPGAGPERGDRGVDRAGVLVSTQLQPRGSVDGSREERQEPVELVDERGERGSRPGRPGRPVRRSEKAPAEVADGLPRVDGASCDRRRVAGETGFREIGEGSARAGRVETEGGACPCGPEQHVRADSRRGRHPSRRAGMAESGAGTVTGRTKLSSAAVPAAAK